MSTLSSESYNTWARPWNGPEGPALRRLDLGRGMLCCTEVQRQGSVSWLAVTWGSPAPAGPSLCPLHVAPCVSEPAMMPRSFFTLGLSLTSLL